MKRSLNWFSRLWFMAALLFATASTNAAAKDDFFRDRIEPVLRQRFPESAVWMKTASVSSKLMACQTKMAGMPMSVSTRIILHDFAGPINREWL